MEKQKGIGIIEIVLLESNFKRSKESYDGKIKNHIALDLEFENLNEPIFSTILKLIFKSTKGKKTYIKATIVMKGVFEIVGERPSFFEEFCYVNTPAIIYPYLREHLASLTNKSGVETINLPTFNFVAFGKDFLKKQKEKLKEQEL